MHDNDLAHIQFRKYAKLQRQILLELEDTSRYFCTWFHFIILPNIIFKKFKIQKFMLMKANLQAVSIKILTLQSQQAIGQGNCDCCTNCSNRLLIAFNQIITHSNDGCHYCASWNESVSFFFLNGLLRTQIKSYQITYKII